MNVGQPELWFTWETTSGRVVSVSLPSWWRHNVE